MSRLNDGVDLTREQQAELERLVAAPTTPQRLVKRARIVLLRAEGRTQLGTATEAGWLTAWQATPSISAGAS